MHRLQTDISGQEKGNTKNYIKVNGCLALIVLIVSLPVLAIAQNKAPEANDDYLSVAQNSTLTVDDPGVLDNDQDADGDKLTVSLVSDVENGSLTLNQNGSLEYTPTTDFMGPDSLDYKIEDPEGAKDTARVYIQVHEPYGEIGFMRSGQEPTFADNMTTAVIGDLDGDQDPDIITQDDEYMYSIGPDNKEIHIYLNDGKGNFSESANSIDIEKRETDSHSALADVDGDQDLDYLLVGDGETYLFLNDGKASFTRANAGLPDTDDGRAAFGDIDNDYDQDLVLTGVDQNDQLTTKVLINDGQGNFTDASAGLDGVTGGGLALADFDQDGNLDIVANGTGDDNAPYMFLYYGEGDATFPESANSFYYLEDGTVSAGDVDNDGDPDLLISGYYDYDYGHLTFLYKSSGDRNFELSYDTFAGIGGREYPEYDFTQSAMNDIDGDGDLDIVLSGPDIAKLYVNDGTGDFHSVESALIEGTNFAGVTDIDGDYDNDIILGRYSGINIYPNRSIQTTPNRKPTFLETPPSKSVAVAGDNYYSNAAAGDPDGDSLTFSLSGDTSIENFTYKDSLIGTAEISFQPDRDQVGVSKEFTLETSDGSLSENTSFEIIIPEYFYYHEKDLSHAHHQMPAGTADLNNDGYLDVVSVEEISYDSDSTVVYINNGDGTYTQRDKRYGMVRIGAMAFGDINNDGYQDMLISGESDDQNVTRLYQGDGNGDFTKMDTDLTGFSFASNAIHDLNGDGNADIFISGNTASSETSPNIETHIYFGDGSGSFTQSDNDISGHGEVAFADVDGDGDLDYVQTGMNAQRAGVTQLYINDGSGIFSEASDNLTDVRDSDVAFVDVENDGDPDIILSGVNGSGAPVTQLFVNDGSGNFSTSTTDLMGVKASQLAVGDFENDGDKDLTVYGEVDDEDVFDLYINDGSGNFAEAQAGVEAPFEEIYFFQDFDKDSDSDLLFLNGTYYESMGGSGTVAIDDSPDQPTKVTLENNYPNPFNPTTQIQFSLPQASEVQLKVYDILGREVQTLIDGRRSAGRYTTSFNAGELTSGMYIYRLKAGSTTITRKMTLIK
jgi:hypothetical protein